MKFAEIHCHTIYSNINSKYGVESITTPELLLKTAKDRGLSAIALTDHNTTKGNLYANKISEKYGIVVIRAEEFDTDKKGQILGYGFKSEIKSYRPAKDIIRDIQSSGGVAIVPHPFDIVRGMEDLDSVSKLANGIEVLNCGATKNNKALHYAIKNNIKIRTGGSDAHTHSLVGSIRLGFPDFCETAGDYVNCLREGKFELCQTENYYYSMLKGGLNVLKSRLLGILNRNKYIVKNNE